MSSRLLKIVWADPLMAVRVRIKKGNFCIVTSGKNKTDLTFLREVRTSMRLIDCDLPASIWLSLSLKLSVPTHCRGEINH